MNQTRKLNSFNILVFTACIVLASVGLRQAQMIFIPLFSAYIIFVLLTPLTTFLNSKFRISRKLYNGLIFSILIFIIIFSFRYFWNSFNQLISELDVYYKQVNQFLELYINKLEIKLPDLEIKDMLQQEISSPLKAVIGATSSAAKNLGQIIILTFVCSLFFLFDPHSLAGLEKKYHFKKLQNRLRHYVMIKTITSLATGLIISLYLVSMGYKFIFFLSIATILLNFIPSFGSFFATMLLIPVFGIEAQSGSEIFIALIFPALTQFVIGNIIEPKFMGNALNLGPIVIILSLIFWGIIFGAYGLFLGVPLTLVVHALIKASDFESKLYESV